MAPIFFEFIVIFRSKHVTPLTIQPLTSFQNIFDVM